MYYELDVSHMDTKELAALLNGRKYGEVITREEEKLATENNLVVVFGASDDLIEFRGVINDEIDAYSGATVYLNKDGIVIPYCDDCTEKCKLFKAQLASARKITAVWDDDGYSICDSNGYTWTYRTDILHETFEILEDEEKYCRGIVFSMKDV
jgi:hypothetical protein